MATRMLRALGHEATSAADGEQGLAYYREHASEIDLVLLDLTMPVMDGCTCFRHMREVNPDVRVVLSTGEPGRREVREVLEEGALGLLRKPYTVSQLAEALDNALQARPS